MWNLKTFSCFSNYAILSWCNCAQGGQLRSWTEPIVRYALQRVRCPCSWSRMVLDCHERLDVLGLHYNAVYDKQEPWEPWEPWLKDQVYVDVRADAGSSHCALGRCHRMESMECSCSQSLVVMSAWGRVEIGLESWQPEILSFREPFRRPFRRPFNILSITVTVSLCCVRVVYVLCTCCVRVLTCASHRGAAPFGVDHRWKCLHGPRLPGAGGTSRWKEYERRLRKDTKGYERLRDA